MALEPERAKKSMFRKCRTDLKIQYYMIKLHLVGNT